MAIAVAGTPTAIAYTGANYTAESGSNRAVVFVVCTYQASAVVEEPSGVTFNSVGCTLFYQGGKGAGTPRCNVAMYYMLESSLPAGSNAVEVSYTNTPTEAQVVCYTLTGVDQTTPEKSSVEAEAASVVDITLPSLTTDTDGYAIAGITGNNGSAVTITGPAGWTDRVQGAMGARKYYTGDIATDGSVVSGLFDHDSIGTRGIVGVSFNAFRGNVYVNDATTLDGGEVLQTYPGAANWADTQIDMQNVIDKGALTGQLYLLVETATGAVASRAITVESGVTISIPTGPVR